MAIRDKLRANAAVLLEPGETIQAVFCAQTIDPYDAMVSVWIVVFSVAFRIVVVTDRRILVCRSGRLATQVKGVDQEIPRATTFGEPAGRWWECESLGPLLYVHKHFHRDVRAADAALCSREA